MRRLVCKKKNSNSIQIPTPVIRYPATQVPRIYRPQKWLVVMQQVSEIGVTGNKIHVMKKAELLRF